MFEANKLVELFEDENKTKPKHGISYILSKDVIYDNNAVKRYIGFNDKKEYKKYISNNTNLYERIYKPVRKIAFDLLDHHIELSHIEFNNYIEMLLNNLNDVLKIELTIDDLIIMVNQDDDNDENKPLKEVINSAHVIVKSHSMHYLQQKELITYMLDVKKIVGIDDAIYSKGQDYRLYLNSKIKPYKESNKYEFLIKYNKKQQFKLHEMLLSETAKTIELYFKSPETKKEIDKNEDGTPKPDKEIYENDLIIKNIIHLDDRFYTTKADWKHTTRLIKKLNLYNIDEWNKHSVNKGNNYNKKNIFTTNTQYTIEKNKLFIDSIDTEQITSGYSTLKQILQKYLPYTITFIKNPLNNLLFNFIKKTYENIDIVKFKETITKEFETRTKATKTKDYIYENLIINLHTGKIQNEFNVIHNFIYDSIEPDNDFNFFDHVINDISEVEIIVNEFINSSNCSLYVSSKWGTGKTSMIIKKIIEHYKKSILMITESNTLNGKLKVDFEKFDFVSHLDKQHNKNINLNCCNNVVCSIQSIKHIEEMQAKIIIIDETESVFNAFFSTSTFKKGLKNMSCFQLLKQKMMEANKLLFLDADLNRERIEILETFIKKEKSLKVINLQNNFHDYKLNIFNHKQDITFINKLHNDIINDKKVIYCSSVNKRTNEIFEDIKNKFENKNILMINSGGVSLRTQTEDFKERNDDKEHKNYKLNFLNNLEENITKLNIDVFLFTPTIKTGVSINDPYFNVCYGHFKIITIIAKETIQQLFRARKLKDKEINIFINENFKKKDNATNYKQMQIQLQNKTGIINHINQQYKNDESDVETNSDFMLMQSLNYTNAINSLDSFGIDFFKIIKFHNMIYKYVPEQKFEDLKKIVEDLKNIQKEIEIERLNKIVNCPLLTYTEYKTLLTKKETIENNDSDETYLTPAEEEQLIKFNLFISIFNLKPIFEAFEQHTLKNTEQQQKINNNIILNIIDYEHTNTPEFYKKFDSYTIKDLWNIRNIMNKDYKTIDYMACNPEHDDKGIKWHIVKKTIELFDYNTEHKKKTITNKQFEELLTKNNDYVNNDIFNYVTQVKRYSKMEYLKHIDLTNREDFIKYKTTIKNLYHLIKEILSIVDIEMKYLNTCTNRDNDKILIQNNNQLIKYPIKTNFKNKSLNGVKELIEEAKAKTSKNYKLNKQELKYLDELNDYFENIDKDQKITTTTTKHLKKHQLFKKININNVNQVQDNYKFYKPDINKETMELKQQNTNAPVYNNNMFMSSMTDKRQRRESQFIPIITQSDDILNEIKENNRIISPTSILTDTYDNNEPNKLIEYKKSEDVQNKKFNIDNERPIYLMSTDKAKKQNGYMFIDDDED